MLIRERGQREVEQEIADLVAAHHADLVRLCQRRLGGDRHLAEDVVQETFVKLGRALASGQEIQNPRGWLRTVASNGTVDELRKRRAMVLVEVPDHVGVEDVDLGGASAELEAAWEGLTPRHREVLRLRELEGLRYDEIAAAMSTRVSAVETLLFRARTALRREYTRAAANLTSAQAQLAAAPVVGAARDGDGWLGRVAGKAGGPAASGLLEVLRHRVAELVAAVAIGGAALGAAAPATPAPAVPLPDASAVAEVPSVTVPAVPPVEAPTVPAAPAVPDTTVPAPPPAPTAPEPPAPLPVVDIVAEVVDDVLGDDGIVRDLLDPTARNR